MQEIIVTGKTVEEATENGCQQLGRTRDEVSVEILEMPARKLFKVTPAKVKITVDEPSGSLLQQTAAPDLKTEPQTEPAKHTQHAPPAQQKNVKKNMKIKTQVLEVEPETPIDLSQNIPASLAVEYLQQVFAAMGATEFTVHAFSQGDATLLRVEGENFANVLDVRGETIQALSYLTDRAANKGVDKSEDEYLRIRLDVAGYRNRREVELIAIAQKTGEEVAHSKRSRTLPPMNAYERLIVHTTISEMEGLVSESRGTDVERRVVIRSTAADATEGEDWKMPRPGGGRDRRPQGGKFGNKPGGSRPGNFNRKPGGSRQGGGEYRGGQRPSFTPDREYANKPRNVESAPKVPERRDAIHDGDDLPLYGKIDI